jgi:hypothetical protein
MGNTIELEVHLARDEGTGRWYIASSDLPGLRLEADTAPDLIREIENVAPDLIELNYDEISAFVRSVLRPPSGPLSRFGR